MEERSGPFSDPAYRTWIETLNDIPMEDVADEYGLERMRNSILCPEPQHADTHLGNCKIYHNRYYCFACQLGGDNVHMVQNLTGLRFMQAAEDLARRMHVPVYRPDWEHVSGEPEEEPMPVTKEQLGILGLLSETRRVMDMEDFSEWKPDLDERYARRYREGWVTGSTTAFSIEKLYREDKEGFYSVLIGKFHEVSERYLSLYQEKIWTWSRFSPETQPLIQRAIEHALLELKAIAEDLTGKMLVDLSGFQIPEFEQKQEPEPERKPGSKRKFSLVV